MHAIEVGKGEILPLTRWEYQGEVKNKTKPLFPRNEAWHSQNSIVVVAKQLTDQWVVLEGHTL